MQQFLGKIHRHIFLFYLVPKIYTGCGYRTIFLSSKVWSSVETEPPWQPITDCEERLRVDTTIKQVNLSLQVIYM